MYSSCSAGDSSSLLDTTIPLKRAEWQAGRHRNIRDRGERRRGAGGQEEQTRRTGHSGGRGNAVETQGKRI